MNVFNQDQRRVTIAGCTKLVIFLVVDVVIIMMMIAVNQIK